MLGPPQGHYDPLLRGVCFNFLLGDYAGDETIMMRDEYYLT
jgi:hypothetical protein